MGTRSLTYVFADAGNGEREPIMCMYRQFDGYVSGHGAELAEFLNGFEIVNGYGEAKPKLANGMGCLAAQLVAHFKVGTGGFYLEAPVLGRDHCQEYEYHVYENKVMVFETGYGIESPYDNEPLFEGTFAEFAEFCNVTEEV